MDAVVEHEIPRSREPIAFEVPANDNQSEREHEEMTWDAMWRIQKRLLRRRHAG